MRKSHRTFDSFLISAILHIIFIVILSSYITFNDERQAASVVNVTWVNVPEQNINIPRPLLDESLLKKTRLKLEPGMTPKTSKNMKPANFAQSFTPSSEVIHRSVELNVGNVQNKVIPDIVTTAKIGPSKGIPVSGPVPVGGGSVIGKGTMTGMIRAGAGLGGAGTGTSGRGLGGGLSVIDSGMAQDAGIMPDSLKSPKSLREDEIGGMLIGRGNDISGHIRLIRVKHGLSDWWQDPTALTGLVDWLNKNTRIRADMKVLGGVLALDDSQLFNAPLIIMTGHDRDVTLSHNLTQPDRGSRARLAEALTDKEKAGLREYLVDKGGMLFFDDCGFKGLFSNEVRSMLREILPEYSLENIPRTHEVFNCYYNLPGPPKGSEMFWGSENEGKGTVFPYLQGITIGRRLAVIFSRKDYLCSIETVEIPSHTQLRYRYSPDVYKFVTNLVVYAMKYGGITDRSDYN